MDAETKGLVERAALKWCGEKREFSLADTEYFLQNWQSLPGLNQYVIDEAAATITRLTAERDEARAECERLREVERRYGDRIRMASAPARLQHAIDEAMAEELAAKEPGRD